MGNLPVDELVGEKWRAFSQGLLMPPSSKRYGALHIMPIPPYCPPHNFSRDPGSAMSEEINGASAGSHSARLDAADPPYEVNISAALERYTERVTRRVARKADSNEE